MKSDLMFSKSRLALVKDMSILGLELLAILIGLRCVQFVETQIKLPPDSIVLMTNLQCMLQWISSKKMLLVFIENRVKEIRHHKNVEFCYVNTKDNLADITSRGCSLSNLCDDKLWWHGQTWLLLLLHKWPKTANKMDDEDENFVLDKETDSYLKDTEKRKAS